MKTMTVVLEIETDGTAAQVRRGVLGWRYVYADNRVTFLVKQVSVQVADQTKHKSAKKRIKR